MEKELTAPTIIRKISVRDTLLNIDVGDFTIINTRHIKAGNLRSTASRLESAGIARFEVSEKGLVNQVKVTRLKL